MMQRIALHHAGRSACRGLDGRDTGEFHPIGETPGGMDQLGWLAGFSHSAEARDTMAKRGVKEMGD